MGLTCRVGRAVTGHIDMIRDVLDGAHLICCTCCCLVILHVPSPHAEAYMSLGCCAGGQTCRAALHSSLHTGIQGQLSIP